ncbi:MULTISPECIES: hypothetical protein [unclassified Sphingomonas]|uniref:hypothetical protein n=1 Tax=unclassified Sphingomonas TaxID=196159 RepID=UPI000FF0E9BD|nr:MULTISPECIES: hypothetical protein [unclassified Sphingomonas]RKE53582.1 hypothetical protein C8J39_0730 [Sphingomonas sp. PP-CC-1A-547]TCM10076.1 hypothetical protein C8J41_101586 [Sphingomonas sp. PP-CC-3G-468]
MSDKVHTPVPGNPASKGAPDGVSDSPRGNDDVHGRSEGGESGGGSYPNPHAGKTETNTGFMAHGGQTDIAYHGGGQAGEDGGNAGNGVAGSDGGDRTTIAADPDADREPHVIAGEGRTIEVVETSGIAEAEASGKIGTDANYENEQKQPGAG